MPRIQRPSISIQSMSSWAYLESPRRLTRSDFANVRAVEHKYLRSFGINPGSYESFDEIQPPLYGLLQHLLDDLEQSIAQFSQHDLVISSYKLLERFYGHQAAQRTHEGALTVLDGQTRSVDWSGSGQPDSALSTLGIRFLLEMSIKHGGRDGDELSSRSLDQLCATAIRITEIDQFLEHVYWQVVPHVVTFTRNWEVHMSATRAGVQAAHDFYQACAEQQSVAASSMVIDQEEFLTRKMSESEVTGTEIWRTYDPAFQEELGYTLTEWLHFCTAALKRFEEHEHLRVEDKHTFTKTAKSEACVGPTTFESLLGDRLINREMLKSVVREEMLPAGNYWRDYRLTNRPFIQVVKDGIKRIVYGVEVLHNNLILIYDLLSGAREAFPRARQGGAISKVVGKLNESSGDPLRDEVVAESEALGLRAVPEKLSVLNRKPDSPMGPIDVLVVDHRHQRFVAVEAKLLSFRRTPREWSDERRDFLGTEHKSGYLMRLESKRRWFSSCIKDLNEEFDIPSDVLMRVESVVVTSVPSMWVFASPEPQPVLVFDEFLRRLENGEGFSSKPPSGSAIELP